MKSVNLRGATSGKGGVQTVTPVEAPDTLRSKSFARVVDLTSEGEIEGPADSEGKLVENASVDPSSFSVVDGVIVGVPTVNRIEVLVAGLGYPSNPIAPIKLITQDPTGSGAVLHVVADPEDGHVLYIHIVTGGVNFSATPLLLIPPVLGKAIVFDNTPLQNSDLTFNHEDVTIVSRVGTQDQLPIPGFEGSQQVVYSDNLEISVSTPQEAPIIDPTIDFLIVGIGVGQFFEQKLTGDVIGVSVKYRVSLKYQDEDFKVLYEDTLNGKSTSGYVRTREVDIRFSKTNPPDHRWILRAERLTPEAANSQLLRDKIFLNFVTGVTFSPFSYPNSALMAVEVNAEQFKQVPVRGYRLKGIKIQVPTNYFPATRLYNRDSDGNPVFNASGDPEEQIWDGTFYIVWSDNPAWCFYDLITNSRYGLGDYIGTTGLDKWMLYRIARYCDVLVKTGFKDSRGQDTFEPRFTCNLYLQTKQEAYKVLTDMASIFRGLLYWSLGTVVAVQDSPEPSFWHFTIANVKDGLFTYASTARTTQHSVCYVRWNDPLDNFKPKMEYVEDVDSILKFGYREIELSAFGCTSRGQAHRLGKWLLFTERIETETVTFQTGMEGIPLRPGLVIDVSDNNRSGVFFGGRILKISEDRIKITTDRKKAVFDAQLADYIARVLSPEASAHFEVILFDPTRLINPVEITSSEQISQINAPQIIRIGLGYSGAPDALSIENTSPLPSTVTGAYYEYQFTAEGGTPSYTWTISSGTLPAGLTLSSGGLLSGTITAGAADFNFVVKVTDESPVASSGGGIEVDDDGFLVLNLLDQAAPDEVVIGSIWGLSSTGVLEPQQFRVLSITESDKFLFEIVAIEHHFTKYAVIEEGLQFEETPISVLPAQYGYPEKPTGLELTFSSVLRGSVTIFQVHLHWDAAGFSYVKHYEVWLQKDLGNFHYRVTTEANHTDIEVDLPGFYTFRVYAIGYLDRRSLPAQKSIDVEIIDDIGGPPGIVSDLQERITGLELFNSGNADSFEGRDAVFDWRINSPTNSYDIGSEPSGGNSGGNSADFMYYEVRIYSPREFLEWAIGTTYAKDAEVQYLGRTYASLVDDNLGNTPPPVNTGSVFWESNGIAGIDALVRYVITKDSNYTFGFDENRATHGGPHRDFIFEVTARTVGNHLSKRRFLRVNNPHPHVPEGVTVNTSVSGQISFQFPGSAHRDFAGWRVWVSQTIDFDVRITRPTYEGTANPLTLPRVNGATYYRYAEYDVFSEWIEYANFTDKELFDSVTGAISAQIGPV